MHDIPGLLNLLGGERSFSQQLRLFFDSGTYVVILKSAFHSLIAPRLFGIGNYNSGNEPDQHAPFLFPYARSPADTQRIVRGLLFSGLFLLVFNFNFVRVIRLNKNSFKFMLSLVPFSGNHVEYYYMYLEYGAAADGLPGNDDAGQMGAWFVWAALGCYPVNHATGQYVLGAPLFPR